MNTLQVGYGCVNINPMLGIGLHGYYTPRFAKGFLDDLEASALAIRSDDNTVLLFSIDNCEMDVELVARYRTAISKATDISTTNIILTSTHTHTGR